MYECQAEFWLLLAAKPSHRSKKYLMKALSSRNERAWLAGRCWRRRGGGGRRRRRDYRTKLSIGSSSWRRRSKWGPRTSLRSVKWDLFESAWWKSGKWFNPSAEDMAGFYTHVLLGLGVGEGVFNTFTVDHFHTKVECKPVWEHHHKTVHLFMDKMPKMKHFHTFRLIKTANFIRNQSGCNMKSKQVLTVSRPCSAGSRPARWPATCPYGRRSSTCAPTSSRRATAWTPATRSSSQRRCVRATWWRWEARSSPGRNAGSSSTASKGPSPTTSVRGVVVVLIWCCGVITGMWLLCSSQSS